MGTPAYHPSPNARAVLQSILGRKWQPWAALPLLLQVWERSLQIGRPSAEFRDLAEIGGLIGKRRSYVRELISRAVANDWLFAESGGARLTLVGDARRWRNVVSLGRGCADAVPQSLALGEEELNHALEASAVTPIVRAGSWGAIMEEAWSSGQPILPASAVTPASTAAPSVVGRSPPSTVNRPAVDSAGRPWSTGAGPPSAREALASLACTEKALAKAKLLELAAAVCKRLHRASAEEWHRWGAEWAPAIALHPEEFGDLAAYFEAEQARRGERDRIRRPLAWLRMRAKEKGLL